MGLLLFIIAIILLLVGVALIPVKKDLYGPSEYNARRGEYERKPAGTFRGITVAWIPIVLAVLLILISCVTTIGTKDVGVLTTFGKPSNRDLPNGIHLKAPWQNVTELDGTIHPDEWTVPVRIGDSSTSHVESTIRWRIVPTQAPELFQDYRANDVNANIKQSLVKTQYKAALNDVLGQYNPLQQIAVSKTSSGAQAKPTKVSTAANLDSYSNQVRDSMNAHLKAAGHGVVQVKVVSVTISYIHLADATQSKINDYLKEVGATRVAEQREQTATAQAAANRTLRQSVSNDPNVLVSKCFDAVEESIRSNYQLPAGFSCWQGGGSSVVVPSSR